MDFSESQHFLLPNSMHESEDKTREDDSCSTEGNQTTRSTERKNEQQGKQSYSLHSDEDSSHQHEDSTIVHGYKELSGHAQQTQNTKQSSGKKNASVASPTDRHHHPHPHPNHQKDRIKTKTVDDYTVLSLSPNTSHHRSNRHGHKTKDDYSSSSNNSSSDSSDSDDDSLDDQTEDEEGRDGELGIIRCFEFSSVLRRMSVIVRRLDSADMQVFVKGSPESIQALCRTEGLPDSLNSWLEHYGSSGFRINLVIKGTEINLAVGTRTVSRSAGRKLFMNRETTRMRPKSMYKYCPSDSRYNRNNKNMTLKNWTKLYRVMKRKQANEVTRLQRPSRMT